MKGGKWHWPWHMTKHAQYRQAFCLCSMRNEVAIRTWQYPGRGALGTACNNNINTMAEKRERNAISCHATQDSKVLFVWKGSQKEARTLSLQCLLLPDGAAGCTRSNITAGRRVREKQTLDSRSLMTAGTLDRYCCVSVLEIMDFVYFKVWYCI